MGMAMRQDCKHFQSRTYPSGDAMRKCALDLAPEAPWQCPAECPKFERRLADVNWRHGTLVTPATPEGPKSVGEDPSIGALLDAAEDIINAAGPSIKADIQEEDARRRSAKKARPRWWPFRR